MNQDLNMTTFFMRFSFWKSAVFFALTLFLLNSCAAPPVISLLERPTRDALLTRLDASRTAYSSMRGLGKYRFSQGGKSFSATQVLLVQKPDKLRVETFGLFGSLAMLLTTDGEQLTVLLPGEGKAYQGEASSRVLQRFMQLPLREEDIVAILLQRPLLTAWDDDEIRYDSDGNSALILKNAYGVRQEILFDPQLNIVGFDYYLADGLQMRLLYNEFDQKTRFAHQFQLTLPLDELEISFTFSEVDLNTTLPIERFRLTVPAGYTPLPLYKESR